MSADEEGTLTRLKSLRHDVIDPLVAENRGRLVKLTGDGALIEFSSAVDAVRCAVAIQNAVATRTPDEPAAARFALRVGINVGDVIIDGDDLYGDGVNVAARLEALAEPGGILISGFVHDHVADRLAYRFEALGDQHLKNIDRPVRVFRVLDPQATATPATSAPPSSRVDRDKPSIVVLPFANISGDAGQDFFAEGLTEDIITELSRFRQLFVISRTTSFAFKGKTLGVRDVTRQLGVQYALEGSVDRKSGV